MHQEPASNGCSQPRKLASKWAAPTPPLGRRWIGAGETLAFHIVLVGKALANLPLIAYAMQRAFERGIGPRRARGEVEEIVLERPDAPPEPIWDAESSSILPHEQTLTVPQFADIGAVTLRKAKFVVRCPQCCPG